MTERLFRDILHKRQAYNFRNIWCTRNIRNSKTNIYENFDQLLVHIVTSLIVTRHSSSETSIYIRNFYQFHGCLCCYCLLSLPNWTVSFLLCTVSGDLHVQRLILFLSICILYSKSYILLMTLYGPIDKHLRELWPATGAYCNVPDCDKTQFFRNFNLYKKHFGLVHQIFLKLYACRLCNMSVLDNLLIFSEKSNVNFSSRAL
jgi:hypothetical protein